MKHPTYEQVREAILAGRTRKVQITDLERGDIFVPEVANHPIDGAFLLVISRPHLTHLMSFDCAGWTRRGGRYILCFFRFVMNPWLGPVDVVHDFNCDIEWQLFMDAFTSQTHTASLRPWENDLQMEKIVLPHHNICRCDPGPCTFTRARAIAVVCSHREVKMLCRQILSRANALSVMLPNEVLEQVLLCLWQVLWVNEDYAGRFPINTDS